MALNPALLKTISLNTSTSSTTSNSALRIYTKKSIIQNISIYNGSTAEKTLNIHRDSKLIYELKVESKETIILKDLRWNIAVNGTLDFSSTLTGSDLINVFIDGVEIN